MREIESQIKEKRTIEATKKRLMGFNGKLGCIVRNLGQPIIYQSEGGGLHDYGPALDPWAMEDDQDPMQARSHEDLMKRIPTMQVRDKLGNPLGDPGDYATEWWSEPRERTEYVTDAIGWHFDGLNRGMHLEIKYEDLNKELTVTYRGHQVYHEAGGELRGYAPTPEWEDWVETLYRVAEKMDLAERRKVRQEELDQARRKKESWWAKTRKRWGL